MTEWFSKAFCFECSSKENLSYNLLHYNKLVCNENTCLMREREKKKSLA